MSGNEKNKSTTQTADKKWFMVIVAVIVCFAFSPPQAGADTWLERQKLLASDGAANDRFGTSVSISGDYAIVGADGDDGLSGSAYIFKRDGTSWSQQAKLLASDGAAEDQHQFGYSVCISGDYAIVGAYGDDSYKGSAYIFKRDGTSWVQQQKLLASDGAINDFFGYSVFISGDHVIVGAYGSNGNVPDSGSAYIFKRDGTSWSEQTKILASDGAANDQFGCSVSISGDHAIVGAQMDDDKGTNSGSAYIFLWGGTSWSQQQKLTASDGAFGDCFGGSVFISGDLVIVGVRYDDDRGTDSGSACIFKRNGTNWVQQQKLLASDGAVGDQFGYSVSISGDHAIIGAFSDDNCKGSADLFRWDGTVWNQQQKLLDSDGAAFDYFGYSVSISGDYAIVGAYYGNGNVTDSGLAYIFSRCPMADLNDDCKVNFADFAIFANWWLHGTD
jgi:hypothetical protein